MLIDAGRHYPCRPPAFSRMTSRLTVGPTRLGPAKSAHIVTPSITVHGVGNMSAITVAQAQLGTANAFLCRCRIEGSL